MSNSALNTLRSAHSRRIGSRGRHLLQPTLLEAIVVRKKIKEKSFKVDLTWRSQADVCYIRE